MSNNVSRVRTSPGNGAKYPPLFLFASRHTHLKACDARECSYPPSWIEIVGGRAPDADEVRVLTYYMSQYAAQPDFFDHLLRILPVSVDEAKVAGSRNEIEMEKRLLASSTVKPSASISKEDLTKIVAAASKRAIDSLAQMSSAQIDSNTGPEIAKTFSRLPTFQSMLAPDTKHLVVADEVSNQALSIEEERDWTKTWKMLSLKWQRSFNWMIKNLLSGPRLHFQM